MSGGTVAIASASLGAAVLFVYDLLALDDGAMALPQLPVRLHTLAVAACAVAVILGALRRLLAGWAQRDEDAVARAGQRGFELGREYERSQHVGVRDLALVRGRADD